MKYVDIHCHFFSRRIFSKGPLSAVSFLRVQEMAETVLSRWENTPSSLSKLLSVTVLGLSESAEDVLDAMDRAYGENWIYAPLTLDLDYVGQGAEKKPKDKKKQEEWFSSLRKALTITKGPLAEVSGGLLEWLDHARRELGDRPSKPGIPMFSDKGYLSQLDEMRKLKAAHPDRVYPFLSIDPRRYQGVKEIQSAMEEVGPGQTFHGIKLYPPLGYSPTDPLLFGEGGVYQTCQKRQIPITVHTSAHGFSTLADRLPVRGDVFFPASGEVLPAADLFENGVVEFKNDYVLSLPSKAIEERTLVLDHPALWHKVLERYPRLRLNLGHLGGSLQAAEYLRSPARAFWTRRIIDLLDAYPNLYADLSGYSTSGDDAIDLRRFKSDVYDRMPRGVRSRILYGSDYFILLFKDPDLHAYLEAFKEAFGDEFNHIASRNALKFLGMSAS